MSDDKLEKTPSRGLKETVFQTERWIIRVRESESNDGSVVEIQSKSGEFILTDLGSGTAYHPAIKVQIALRSKR